MTQTIDCVDGSVHMAAQHNDHIHCNLKDHFEGDAASFQWPGRV